MLSARCFGAVDGRVLGSKKDFDPSDMRRRSEPDYKVGWNSVPDPAPNLQIPRISQQLGYKPAPQPPLPDLLAPNGNPAFAAGVADRQNYEAWFAALDADGQGGAAYWAETGAKQRRDSMSLAFYVPFRDDGRKDA